MSTDPTVTINDTEYALSSLSEDARAQINMLKITDQEIQRLQGQLAIAQTARLAYGKALQAALPTPTELAMQSDTVKLN
jgi:hypothetical protein